MIEQFRRALVLAPHTDDGEVDCGDTMARLVEPATAPAGAPPGPTT